MTRLNYPLLFHPVYKDYLWGGCRIPRKYHRAPQPGTCAESWEISDRPEGMSVVANGWFAGWKLGKLVARFPGQLVGEGFTGKRFPLLIKLIDAKLRLSVQVHPAEESADATHGEPKTEMWYVLGARPGAKVFVGLRKSVTGKSFDDAVRSGALAGILNPVRVRPADAVFVPGGTIHCIGEGVLLLEVQQNSNTTFRVYDWDRAGSDGSGRPLHVADAKKSMIWSGRTGPKPGKVRRRVVGGDGRSKVWEVLDCSSFRIERLDLSQSLAAANDSRSFHAFFVVDGKVRISAGHGRVTAKAGVSCLIPAAVDKYSLSPVGGNARVIRISLGRNG